MRTQWSIETKRLKHIASIEMGQSPPSGEYSLDYSVGLPFLQGTADFGEIHPLPRVYCNTSTKVAQPEDILFSVRAPVGSLNIADREYGIGRGLCAIRCHNEIDQRFAWWTLHEIRTQLAYQSSGSTYEAVATEDVANLVISLPPLPEQRAIADYLDHATAKIDKLIAAKQRLLLLLTEKRRALITHAVTRGLDANIPMRDSGVEWLGEIPAHWRVKPLKLLAEVRTGVAKGRNLDANRKVQVSYLRVANVQDGYLDLSDIAQIEVLPEEISAFSLKKGDVLMNEGGDADKLGRGDIWDGSIEPCLHQNHVFAVRCFDISPAWLTKVASSDYAKAYFESRAKQSTNLASISATNLQELPVVIPSEDEQIGILSTIDSMTLKLDGLRTALERTISLLQERRVALIAAAVTGKL